ncbi:hypothetical protein BH20ACT11_BH20ACT11_11390 [soil metagenome]|jgi:hypothetical protein
MRQTASRWQSVAEKSLYGILGSLLLILVVAASLAFGA